MLRKIRKLILHPNRYFYDYFRKKLGFRKFFVTDKIRLLDSENHQKWHKVLFSHPYLYLYYKFNKRLRKPAYPILVDYRIENLEKNAMGGGKRVVLTVELERQNIIHFADPEIVLKAISGKEPYLAGKIFKFNFLGNGNCIFIDSGVKFGRNIKINFIGDNNQLHIGADCQMMGGNINFHGSSNSFSLGKSCSILSNVIVEIKGNENSLDLKENCKLNTGFKIIFVKDGNYLYAGSSSSFNVKSSLIFSSSNGLIFICGNPDIYRTFHAHVSNGGILFIGERMSNGLDVNFLVGGAKNILIGADVMMSHYLDLKTNDGHLIYDKNSNMRINQPKSIIIGDHVWIGKSCTILKGANIKDGSIIGAKSIVTKTIPENCIAAGSPAKPVKHEIIWDRTLDFNLVGLKMEEYNIYKQPEYTYKPIGYEKLVKIDAIDSGLSAKEKVKLIKQIINDGK